MQTGGAITCLASLLQHSEKDCCSVICDAYPRMQVVIQSSRLTLVVQFFVVQFWFRDHAPYSVVDSFFAASGAQQLPVGSAAGVEERSHEQ